MNLGKILKSIAVVAGPVVGMAVGGPAGAALVTAGMGAAGLTKAVGQKHEDGGGRPFHKVGSPVAAVAVPALLAQFLSPEALEKICQVAVAICENPAAIAGTLAGVLGILAHTVGAGTQKVVEGRRQ